MEINTKAYIEDDMSALYPLLKEYGFEISEFCIRGTFYDTWSHPESNLVIHAHYDRLKKKRRWFPWRGSWGNFGVSVKLKSSTISYTSDKLSCELKKTFVAYLGGRIEVKTETTHADKNHNRIDVYEYAPSKTKDVQNIRRIIESLIAPNYDMEKEMESS